MSAQWPHRTEQFFQKREQQVHGEKQKLFDLEKRQEQLKNSHTELDQLTLIQKQSF